jgi:LacI family transcriptional regulator
MKRFNNELPTTPRRTTPTIRDVANHAGVSVGTVSNWLSGQHLVLPPTAARVQSAMTALGYRPNGVARGLRSRRTRTIGLLIPDNANPFFAELAWHLEQACAARKLGLMLCNTGGMVDREVSSMEMLLEQRVDGIVVDSISSDDRVAQLAIDAGVPLVVLDREIHGVSADTVAVDSVQGGALAAQHLWGLGHRRLACVLGPMDVASSVDRLNGFLSVLNSVSVTPQETPTVWGEFRAEAGYRAALSLLDAAPQVTAIFAADDLLALGVIRAAHDRHRAVPGDLSVVGFDDIALADVSVPRLTTVHQPLDELADRVVERLVTRLTRPQSAPRRALVAPTLVVRESTAVPRRTSQAPHNRRRRQ